MAKKIARNETSAGQSITELAVILPLLLLILAGVLDLGRAYFAYVTIVNAAREGARYGAENPGAADISSHAKNEAQGSIINPSQLTVAVSFPNGCTAGNPIQVNVGYNFQLITAYIFGGNVIPLQTSAQMAVFGQCP